MPVLQRHHDAHGRVETRHRVAQAEAHAHRRAVGIARQVAQAARRLADGGKARTFRIGPVLTVSRDARHDETGVDLGQGIKAQAPPFHRAGAEILDQDVGFAHEILQDRLACLAAQIDGDGALPARDDRPPDRIAIVIKPPPLAHRVALAGRFDLDDLGAEIGHDLSAIGTCDQLTKFDDPQALQRCHALPPPFLLAADTRAAVPD